MCALDATAAAWKFSANSCNATSSNAGGAPAANTEQTLAGVMTVACGLQIMKKIGQSGGCSQVAAVEGCGVHQERFFMLLQVGLDGCRLQPHCLE
jgi:hypothetical protein